MVLYYLSGLLAVAVVFGFLGILHYSPLAIIFSALVLIFVSWAVNELFSRVFEAQTNVESVYITALILALIIDPIMPTDTAQISFLIWAAVLATASKYILALNKKHMFNPAAFAVALTAFAIGQSASWWAGGNLPMMAFVIAGGVLVARKMRRSDLIAAFFVVALTTFSFTRDFRKSVSTFVVSLLHAPSCFFAFIM